MSKYLTETSILKWKSISEIPDFPFENYVDLIDSIKRDKYLMLVDNSKANAISPYVLSKFSDLVNIILSWLPFVIVLLSFIIGIFSGKYIFFLGALLSIVSFLWSRPYAQWGYTTINKFPLSFLVAIVIIYFINREVPVQIWNASSLIIPFIAGNYYYAKNLKEVQKAAMSDEPLFIYLYQQSSIELINIDNGDSYMYMPDDEDFTDYVKRQADFDNP